MNDTKFPARRGGFTLIELLVVIAIIAILAAILFPVFAKARQKANQTTCISNMKQIGIAMQAYVGDSDGKFPVWTAPGSNAWWSVEDFHSGVDSPWGQMDLSRNGGQDKMKAISWQLDRYIKSREVWQCPSDFGPYKRDDWWQGVVFTANTSRPMQDWPQIGTGGKVGVSYGYRGTNDSPGGQDRLYQTTREVPPAGSTTLGSLAGYAMSDVKAPSERWMFWDHRGWHYTGQGDNREAQRKGRVQVLAFDTHVTTLSQAKVLGPNPDPHDQLFYSILLP